MRAPVTHSAESMNDTSRDSMKGVQVMVAVRSSATRASLRVTVVTGYETPGLIALIFLTAFLTSTISNRLSRPVAIMYPSGSSR